MASYGYTFQSGDGVTPTRLNAARTVSDIVDADIKSDAAIAGSKLADNSVTSAKIADGTIVNADINASAAIAHSKLANITSGRVLLGNASNVPTATAVTGDVTISNTGVTAISSGVIVDADINASAAIALSKLATGALPTAITVASANIVDGTIVNADINASAAIADSKLATISTGGKVSNSATTATSANTANAIVARDASGNFSAGTITASLTGNSSTATTLATGRTIALTGDVTGTTGAFNGSANVSAATTIANNAVTTVKIADANVTTAKVANDAIDNTKIRNSAALSVIGRSANSTGDPDDIAAGTDGHVLRRSGTALGFGQVATAGITDSAVTTSKIADANVTTSKIADANVTNAKIASGVDASKLTTGTLPIARIADAAVTPAKLSQPYTLATAQTSTSGTSIDFTDIPSWAKRITVMFNGVSTNGTSFFLVQLGDAGGFETSGYESFVTAAATTVGTDSSTAGFRVGGGIAARTYRGLLQVCLLSGTTWVASGTLNDWNSNNAFMSGSKTLSGTLTQVRFTTVNGTDTFDAGTINISYEG